MIHNKREIIVIRPLTMKLLISNYFNLFFSSWWFENMAKMMFRKQNVGNVTRSRIPLASNWSL